MAVLPALFGLLMATYVTVGAVDVEPSEAVVKVGEYFEFVCRADYALTVCSVKQPGAGNEPIYLIPGGVPANGVSYHGAGLDRGECGARILVTDAWHGNVTCAWPPSAGQGTGVSGTLALTVAKPPGDIILYTSNQQWYDEGEVFSAMCAVPGGRPRAKITWSLDDEELFQGLSEAKWNEETQTDSQNLTRTLSADDQDRILKCKVEHIAMPSPEVRSVQLKVEYAPKLEESVTIFGLKLNAPGLLNVTVRSNPEPAVVWTIEGSGVTIPAPSVNEELHITALRPLPLGRGYYNVTLVIDPITKDDVDRRYTLRASNPRGPATMLVRISTMEEPAGVELDTGAIVGIVIAVLVLIIAVSLIVFAFATDRWCFAGRRRDTNKSSGESDTESAVGGKERSRLAALSARVLAALPRGKDRVQATEAASQDDDKPADDKVVYATLALSEQTPADKPPPAFAEYAEIVYTDKGQKEAKDTA